MKGNRHTCRYNQLKMGPIAPAFIRRGFVGRKFSRRWKRKEVAFIIVSTNSNTESVRPLGRVDVQREMYGWKCSLADDVRPLYGGGMMELLLWNEDEYFHYSWLFGEPMARDECQLQHIPGSYLLHFSDFFLLSMNVCRARVKMFKVTWMYSWHIRTV